MLSVSLPIWLIIAAAGLPAVLFLFVGIMLVRLKRRGKKRHGDYPDPYVINTPVQFNNQVYKQIVEQQIDAVFNTLITVIESERLKLKALVGQPSLSSNMKMRVADTGSATEKRYEQIVETEEPDPSTTSSELSLGQSIVAMSKKGMTAEQIARQLGLSQTEMSLALKMNNGRQSTVGRRMQAIA